MPPEPQSCIPAIEPIASRGLRTIPPRENGGNLDVKQLVKGTTVYLPVWTEGALFSIGDAHFAQGDGEVCGSAIEMAATFGWDRYVGPKGIIIGMHSFGSSAPLKDLLKKFGFGPDEVVAAAKKVLGK